MVLRKPSFAVKPSKRQHVSEVCSSLLQHCGEISKILAVYHNGFFFPERLENVVYPLVCK